MSKRRGQKRASAKGSQPAPETEDRSPEESGNGPSAPRDAGDDPGSEASAREGERGLAAARTIDETPAGIMTAEPPQPAGRPAPADDADTEAAGRASEKSAQADDEMTPVAGDAGAEEQPTPTTATAVPARDQPEAVAASADPDDLEDRDEPATPSVADDREEPAAGSQADDTAEGTADATAGDTGEDAAEDAGEQDRDPSPPGEITTEQVVEAVLFASEVPLTLPKIVSAIGVGSARDVRKHIAELNRKYEQIGASFRIEQIAGGYQMLTLPAYNTWLRRLKQTKQDSKLSPAALETLAVVAYKQPVVRAEIEALRGVSAGEMLNRLRELGLVKIVGRAEDVGRPMLYGTTRRFLELFGLSSLEDLPEVEALVPPGGE